MVPYDIALLRNPQESTQKPIASFSPRLGLFRDDPVVWRTFAFSLGVFVFCITRGTVHRRPQGGLDRPPGDRNAPGAGLQWRHGVLRERLAWVERLLGGGFPVIWASTAAADASSG
ncbi:hypothetical protein GCM10009760_44520 [Kitasatospora kazusensis]|uniref:Uncharacterized protein n=1 Tax=Kitasatospora kazusensis TaxID=407974 RepID=A0ABN2ZYL8_9ACTN